MGTYTFVRKKSLIGDVIAHAVFPGICLGYLFSGEKNYMLILAGAAITALLSVWLLEFFQKHPRISSDTASAIVLSTFFAGGVLLISYIMRVPTFKDKAGLSTFLFGNTIGITDNDLLILSGILTAVITSIVVFFRPFQMLSFDESYSKVAGVKTGVLKLLLSFLTVSAIVLGVQAVGVVLISALFITPAVTARFWTNKLSQMMIFAAFIATFSSLSGVFISYQLSTSTGPWIVLVLSVIAIITFALAPEKGIVSKLLKNQRFRLKVQKENILKGIYKQEERNGFDGFHSLEEVQRHVPMAPAALRKTLNGLVNDKYLTRASEQWKFTKEGKARGQRLVKLHRLWELYLTEHVNIKDDHVHEDADLIEHIITPQLEAELEKKLGYPKVDPHNSNIPYSS
jgi:manganese/zinc/iron transport system permease protein